MIKGFNFKSIKVDKFGLLRPGLLKTREKEKFNFPEHDENLIFVSSTMSQLY